jgi:hypothetical protein
MGRGASNDLIGAPRSFALQKVPGSALRRMREIGWRVRNCPHATLFSPHKF